MSNNYQQAVENKNTETKNQQVEEKYYNISSIIEEIASKNPSITPQKVALLKRYYRGDTRSIETIALELQAYSTELPSLEPTIFNKNSDDIPRILTQPTMTPSENKDPHPTNNHQETVDIELSDMFVPATPTSAYQGLEERPKQYVKTSGNSTDEGGYVESGTIAILTTAGIFSIISLIIGIAILL